MEASDHSERKVRNDTANETLSVFRIKSNFMFRIPVQVQGVNIKAVVDSAAEVTFLSDRVYKNCVIGQISSGM